MLGQRHKRTIFNSSRRCERLARSVYRNWSSTAGLPERSSATSDGTRHTASNWRREKGGAEQSATTEQCARATSAAQSSRPTLSKKLSMRCLQCVGTSARASARWRRALVLFSDTGASEKIATSASVSFCALVLCCALCASVWAYVYASSWWHAKAGCAPKVAANIRKTRGVSRPRSKMARQTGCQHDQGAWSRYSGSSASAALARC
ncbi:predicted protein [Clavispora lusitaniae ATCC 42720]|uniref:Uncharacterized protein n=1 Tax=Clavispora lusitaniae (strain ATCC 42720) TaxID=306902 RepID=C4Y2R1_CLAL4|nr:uncharacterized protein CLUG_02824 [Clavispora lusitaniae ATCC 42720]EEQ38698.1 predicted protein [Clavispora lusitaniae ATCC 42720]